MDSEVNLVVPYSIRESIIVTTTSIKYVVKAVVRGPADLLFILLDCAALPRCGPQPLSSSSSGQHVG